MNKARKILLIEDFPIIQNLYSKPLKSHGYEVDTANDGVVGLQLAAKNNYDFILLDMLLPNMNGIDFLEKLNKQPKPTKVIVLSDFTDEKITQKAKKLGVYMYLTKAENPPSQLLEKLNSLKSD